MLLLIQRTDVLRKVTNFRNKKFFIAHGTADGKLCETYLLLRVCLKIEIHEIHLNET